MSMRVLLFPKHYSVTGELYGHNCTHTRVCVGTIEILCHWGTWASKDLGTSGCPGTDLPQKIRQLPVGINFDCVSPVEAGGNSILDVTCA